MEAGLLTRLKGAECLVEKSENPNQIKGSSKSPLGPSSFENRWLSCPGAGTPFVSLPAGGKAITTFNYLSKLIRVIEIGGQPWFVAADVRRVLDKVRGGKQNILIGSDEMRVISELNGVKLKGHGLSIISESGLYKLIMRSDKPEAREFQDWVTREVLPAIRKDGMYVAGERRRQQEI